MHKFFYHSVVSLIYKKDQSELDNYRQISLMNMDYKILAKIIMNSMNEQLSKIIEKEQMYNLRKVYVEQFKYNEI